MLNVNLQFYMPCETAGQMAQNILFGDGPKVVAVVGTPNFYRDVSHEITRLARRHHHAIALASYSSLAIAATETRGLQLQGLIVTPEHLMAHPEDYQALASRFRGVSAEARPVMLALTEPAFDVLNAIGQFLKTLRPPARAGYSPVSERLSIDLPDWAQRSLCLAEGSALPVEGSERLGGTGIWLGEPFLDDPTFRHAWLPPGWTLTPARSGQGHWSDLRDPEHQIRFAVCFRPGPERRAFIASVEEPE